MTKVSRIVLSARAEQDLTAIFHRTLERWGEAQARRYAELIDGRLSVLTKVSGAGRAKPELGEGVRSIPIGAHIIFFKISGDEALVLSVRHAKRRAPTAKDFA